MSCVHYLVLTAHRSEYPEPITFAAGAPLTVGERYAGPEGWDEWYLCSTPGQVSGWVPAQVIDASNPAGAVARQAYTARELDVDPGQRLDGGETCNGWVWCTRASDHHTGWVPLSHVQPLSS